MQQDSQDLYGLGMACYDDGWEAAQANDEALEASELGETYERIYRLISSLELLWDCELTDTRKDIRFTELVAMRKVKYE